MTDTKTKILVVHSDRREIREMETKLQAQYLVVGVAEPERTLPMLQADRDIMAVAIATQKGLDVLGILEACRRERPEVLRVLLTAFEDLSVVVEGLHSGLVQRVCSRPLMHAELLGAFRLPNPGATQGAQLSQN